MVSQFVSPDKVVLLSDLGHHFPEGTHAIGRLDNHSEGLLILTTNKNVTRLLFQSKQPHKRTYLVQVKNEVQDSSLNALREGVTIKVKQGADYTTNYCEVEIITRPAQLQFNQTEIKPHLPHTWLRFTITEGKFHQVRKMVKAIGHRCSRLIRVSIEDLCLDELPPGEIKEISETDFFNKLNIEDWQ